MILDGVSVTGTIEASFDAQETVGFTPPKLSVTGKLRHVTNFQVVDFIDDVDSIREFRDGDSRNFEGDSLLPG